MKRITLVTSLCLLFLITLLVSYPSVKKTLLIKNVKSQIYNNLGYKLRVNHIQQLSATEYLLQGVSLDPAKESVLDFDSLTFDSLHLNMEIHWNERRVESTFKSDTLSWSPQTRLHLSPEHFQKLISKKQHLFTHLLHFDFSGNTTLKKNSYPIHFKLDTKNGLTGKFEMGSQLALSFTEATLELKLDKAPSDLIDGAFLNFLPLPLVAEVSGGILIDKEGVVASLEIENEARLGDLMWRGKQLQIQMDEKLAIQSSAGILFYGQEQLPFRHFQFGKEKEQIHVTLDSSFLLQASSEENSGIHFTLEGDLPKLSVLENLPLFEDPIHVEGFCNLKAKSLDLFAKARMRSLSPHPFELQLSHLGTSEVVFEINGLQLDCELPGKLELTSDLNLTGEYANGEIHTSGTLANSTLHCSEWALFIACPTPFEFTSGRDLECRADISDASFVIEQPSKTIREISTQLTWKNNQLHFEKFQASLGKSHFLASVGIKFCSVDHFTAQLFPTHFSGRLEDLHPYVVTPNFMHLFPLEGELVSLTEESQVTVVYEKGVTTLTGEMTGKFNQECFTLFSEGNLLDLEYCIAYDFGSNRWNLPKLIATLDFPGTPLHGLLLTFSHTTFDDEILDLSLNDHVSDLLRIKGRVEKTADEWNFVGVGTQNHFQKSLIKNLDIHLNREGSLSALSLQADSLTDREFHLFSSALPPSVKEVLLKRPFQLDEIELQYANENIVLSAAELTHNDLSLGAVHLDIRKNQDNWSIDQMAVGDCTLTGDFRTNNEKIHFDFLGVKFGNALMASMEGSFDFSSQQIDGQMHLLELNLDSLSTLLAPFYTLSPKGELSARKGFFSFDLIHPLDTLNLQSEAELHHFYVSGFDFPLEQKLSLSFKERVLTLKEIEKKTLEAQFAFDGSPSRFQVRGATVVVGAETLSELLTKNFLFPTLADMEKLFVATLYLDVTDEHYRGTLSLPSCTYPLFGWNVDAEKVDLCFDNQELSVVAHTKAGCFTLQTEQESPLKAQVFYDDGSDSKLTFHWNFGAFQTTPALYPEKVLGTYKGIPVSLQKEKEELTGSIGAATVNAKCELIANALHIPSLTLTSCESLINRGFFPLVDENKTSAQLEIAELTIDPTKENPFQGTGTLSFKTTEKTSLDDWLSKRPPLYIGSGKLFFELQKEGIVFTKSEKTYDITRLVELELLHSTPSFIELSGHHSLHFKTRSHSPLTKMIHNKEIHFEQ